MYQLTRQTKKKPSMVLKICKRFTTDKSTYRSTDIQAKSTYIKPMSAMVNYDKLLSGKRRKPA